MGLGPRSARAAAALCPLAPRFWEGRADMVAAAAPSSAPAHHGLPAALRRAGPERRPRSGMGSGPGCGNCGRRVAGGGRVRQAGALRPWRCRPGSRRSLCLGRPAGAGKGRWGRPASGALCCWAAGPGGARAAAGAAGLAGPDRVNGSSQLVPCGSAAATASASGIRVPEGRKPAALDAGDFCSWDLPAGICGCTASGTKLRILPGHFCLGTISVFLVCFVEALLPC